MAKGTGRGELLSIWFFVGVMTLAYGIVLLPYGAWEWFGGHEPGTVLHELHPTFWWGLLLLIFGASTRFATVRVPATRMLPRQRRKEIFNAAHCRTNQECRAVWADR